MLSPSKKELFAPVRLDKMDAPRVGPDPDNDPRLVAYSVRLPLATLLRLKQALHHLGAGEQEFMAAVLNEALDKLPESRLPLPAAKRAKLLAKWLVNKP